MSAPAGKFKKYKQALATISARSGTPLPSLILSFGILHEVTAVVPVVGIFYGAKALGLGERVLASIVNDKASTPENSKDYSWAKQKMRSWVEEGDRWTIRIGRRYGIFGYEKRLPGVTDDVNEMALVSNHIAGDVANAVFAYGATKVQPARMREGMSLIKILLGITSC